ncbi:MAG: J domain-containing protein [Spirochaetaceae bacterium]|jgi:hypothetical protein|nr:J domain-containing protein [Spirochaetaceae bacterium]
MGIFDRLEYLIRSYLNGSDGESPRVFGRTGSRGGNAFRDAGGSRSGAFADPDVRAAFEELDEFLNRDVPPGAGNGAARSGAGGSGNGNRAGNGGNEAGNRGGKTGGASRPGRAVPGELRPDFAELGVPFGASAASCKSAYKDLLKKYHPDRHSDPESVQKATEKSARINAAWDRIERWLGKTE